MRAFRKEGAFLSDRFPAARCGMIGIMLLRETPGVAIQERDIAILRALFESRVMNIRHIAALFFGGREHAARKRLQRLRMADLVAERPRKTFDRAVLFLTKAGFRLLHERGLLRRYPQLTVATHAKRARVSDITIRHELEVMDVKASLCAAIAKSDSAAVVEFTTWPQLIQFECSPFGGAIVVKPDGRIRIEAAGAEERGTSATYYLELDRSTETLATLVHRARCYVAHLKSGGFAAKSGGSRPDFRNQPFRVLFILKSKERRNNVAEALLGATPPIFTPIWLTTLDDITRDPLGAIWIRPSDYRDALAPAAHTPGRRRQTRGYRRNRERDSAVEAKVVKRRFLD